MATHSHETTTPESETGARQGDNERSGGTASRLKRAGGAVLGGVLLVRGLRRRSVRGAAIALAGAWLLTRALRGGDGGASTGVAAGKASGRSEAGGDATAHAETGTVGPGSGPTGGASATTVSRSITVDRSASELYELWRDPNAFSRILGNVADVTARDDDRFRWTVSLPAGRSVSWETRLAAADPGERLCWETPADAIVSHRGEVRFQPAPGDRGTVVTLSLTFEPPGGRTGARALERLDLVTESLAGEALHRFKTLAESGEVPTLAENPSDRASGELV
jgi:uncharacterized membrane protein